MQKERHGFGERLQPKEERSSFSVLSELSMRATEDPSIKMHVDEFMRKRIGRHNAVSLKESFSEEGTLLQLLENTDARRDKRPDPECYFVATGDARNGGYIEWDVDEVRDMRGLNGKGRRILMLNPQSQLTHIDRSDVDVPDGLFRDEILQRMQKREARKQKSPREKPDSSRAQLILSSQGCQFLWPRSSESEELIELNKFFVDFDWARELKRREQKERKLGSVMLAQSRRGHKAA